MSYTDVVFVFGEQPTASKWNALGINDAGFKDGTLIDEDAIKAITHVDNPYKASVYLDGAQTINDNSQTVVTLDAEDYDPSSDFNTGTNKYTVPVTGWYLVAFQVTLVDSGLKIDTADATVRVDSVDMIINALDASSASTASVLGLGATKVLFLTAGEEVDMTTKSNTTDSGTTAIRTGSEDTYLSIHFLSK